MPTFLKKVDDETLGVTMGKMDKAEFSDALARVKSIPGRVWDPASKTNLFPNQPEIMLRLVTSLQPVVDAEIQTLLKTYASEVAGQLITKLPDDAHGLRIACRDALYPFQRAAVHFAVEHPKLILADEMGLGKTLQSLAIITEHWLAGGNWSPASSLAPKILVICPKAVRGTWAAEAIKWFGWTTKIIDGRTPAQRVEQLKDTEANVFIINWEAFWREPVIGALREQTYYGIVADEAHRAKSHKSKQSKGLRKLSATVQIAATGTPVMNSPDELWPLLNWMEPQTYSSFWRFHNMYVDEIQSGGYNRRVMVGVKNADALRFELKDKLIRRTKKDKLPGLPEKLPTQVIEVPLTGAQRKLYDEAETALFLDIAAHIKAKAAEADDPVAEAEHLMEEFANMPVEKLTALVPNAGARIAKQRQITAAAKVAVANELIREEPDTPVVAFTWHVDAARKLATLLTDGPQGLRVGTIAGEDASDPVKDAFQAGELDHVVCTISKGGTGLTLTRSSSPILVEEDWTPAINDQAIDRTHRIGQTDPVTPRVLRCPDTVDTGRVAPRNTFKRAVAAQIIGE